MANAPLELTEMNGLLNMEFSAVKTDKTEKGGRGDKQKRSKK